MRLPWEPLLTIERSGLPEVTIYGTVTVMDGAGRLLVSMGEQSGRIWTRSCLKPWQLLNHLHILLKNYPQLTEYHYALMLSSHSGETMHLQALDEMLALSGVDEGELQNTPLYPMNPEMRIKLKASGEMPRARWASCSGKHLGFVMAAKAAGEDSSLYLDPGQPHFERMKKLLGYLLNEDWNTIPQTTDGCRLPNYAFAPTQLARLYLQLATGLDSSHLPAPPPELKDVVANFPRLAEFMNKYPQYVGGDDRFDTQLMRNKYTDGAFIFAKEGADGLLTIGVSGCPLYPQGLGIVIKSSSGDDQRYFTLIALELLDKLKLLKSSKRRENKLKHLNFQFHFELAEFAKK